MIQQQTLANTHTSRDRPLNERLPCTHTSKNTNRPTQRKITANLALKQLHVECGKQHTHSHNHNGNGNNQNGSLQLCLETRTTNIHFACLLNLTFLCSLQNLATLQDNSKFFLTNELCSHFAACHHSCRP